MSNPFANWSPEMVKAFNERTAEQSGKEVRKPETLERVDNPRARTSESASGCTATSGAVTTGERASVPNTRQFIELTPRKTTDEEKLNKTESAYLAYLRRLNVPQLRIQKITLKLANDCRFTADFTYVDCNGRMVFVDVKGFQREDAFIKAKVAAHEYTEFRFVIVKRANVGWEETEVRP